MAKDKKAKEGEATKPRDVTVLLPILDEKSVSAALFSLQHDVLTLQMIIQRALPKLDPKIVAESREKAWDVVYGPYRADRVQPASAMPRMIKKPGEGIR